MPRATAGQVPAKRRRGGRLFTAKATGFVTIMSGVSAGYGADAELGRHLSSECMTCHGTAKPGSTIPNIFGLGESHFVAVIKAYRDKALPNPVMQNIASLLSDDDIAALALYFESAKKPK
jgi:cytochrome c553